MNKTVVQLRGQARAGVPPGTRLNDIYEVEEQIAAGGMGEIYRGKLVETGDPVAIKMIKPEFADNESVLALFRKEASALHHLHHDSIVRYYIFGIDRTISRAYLAMEYVDGSALSDILTRRSLTVKETTELRRRVAAGLQVAHDKGIIHRDISPDNIILPEENVNKAKIIDFGIARSTKLGHATVIGDGFAGKYNYVSPEQLGMFGGDVTARSDIYSLGLVMAECLRGKPIDIAQARHAADDRRQGHDRDRQGPGAARDPGDTRQLSGLGQASRGRDPARHARAVPRSGTRPADLGSGPVPRRPAGLAEPLGCLA